MMDVPASTLIRRICHDLTQPLTALQGYIELALHFNQSTEELRQSLMDVGEEAERITELMRAVRTFADALAPSRDPQGIALKAVLADAIHTLPVGENNGPAFFAELDPQAFLVRSDAVRLKTAFQQILDFSLAHGSAPLTVSLEIRDGSGEVLIAGRGSRLTRTDCASLFDLQFLQPVGKHVAPPERFRLAAAALTIQRAGGTVAAESGRAEGRFFVRIIFVPGAD